jgi:hypothetical protein
VSSTLGGHSTDSDGRRSIGELLSDVSQDVTTLLRQEVALAKAEVKQSVSSAGKGVGMFAGAGISGHMVLLFLSIAGWWGLGDGIGRAWAALVVALVWAIIGAVLGLMGRKELKSVGGVPQTTDTLKKIPNAAKGNEEHAHDNQ